jgi:hypothetical protein
MWAATMTNTAMAPAGTPASNSVNPSNLTPHFVDYFGAGAVITPDMAWAQWSGQRNPYIPGSPQYDAFVAYHAEKMEREKKKYMKYPEVPLELKPSKRRLSQPRLKMDFETLHDIRLRLCNSLIFIGSKLWYVREIIALDDDFMLLVEDEEAKLFRTMYKQEVNIDLRSPEPQYFVYENAPAYLVRYPGRQQRQGVNSDTVYGRYVGMGEQVFRLHQYKWLMRSLDTEMISWDAKLADLMIKAQAFRALRMSKDIAFFHDRTKNGVYAEYRGRLLGRIKENTILVDDTDAKKPWINRDVNKIGCSLKVH